MLNHMAHLPFIYLPQHELHKFSAKHGILLMAHQPLGGRPVGVVRGHPDQPFPTSDPTVNERKQWWKRETHS